MHTDANPKVQAAAKNFVQLCRYTQSATRDSLDRFVCTVTIWRKRTHFTLCIFLRCNLGRCFLLFNTICSTFLNYNQHLRCFYPFTHCFSTKEKQKNKVFLSISTFVIAKKYAQHRELG